MQEKDPSEGVVISPDPTLRCSRYSSEEHRLDAVQITDLTACEPFGVRFLREAQKKTAQA